MAFSKVIFNGTTLIDVTDTTATEEDVTSPCVFVKANGNHTTGTNMNQVTILFEQDEEGFIRLDDDTYVVSAMGVSF